MSWLPKKCVLVPVDFSPGAFAAVDAAFQFVTEARQVHVVYVLPTLEPAEPGVIWATIDNDSRRHHAELALRERLADAKYADLQVHVMFGDPGHEIVDLAAQLPAELIVLPSHGRTGLTRILLGSVAERVVRLAHCPVLVLKDLSIS
jgi:nucleotide-binding universal stress UspA family protein